MSFTDLSVEQEATLVPALPEDGNRTNEAIGFLRRAVDAPSYSEVESMIMARLTEFNKFRMIELKTPKGSSKLDTEHRHHLFEEILTAVNADIPVALVGPAGSGKSTVVSQIAKALGKTYYLQNSVTGTHELTGYLDAHGNYHTTAYRTAYTQGGVILIDEVDTSDAAALKWTNTSLANGHAMFPDSPEPVKKHPDFRIVIAANTYGTGADRLYVGANQLDASTLDRFVFFEFAYDQRMEKLLVSNQSWVQRVQNLRAAADKEKVRIVISPRASLHGDKLLAAGWDQQKVEQRVVWKGLDEELKERILKTASGLKPKTDPETEGLARKLKKKYH